MSFNIRYGTADDGPNRWALRKDLLIETIRAFDPDLLGMQEVLASPAAELRTALPGHDFVGAGRDDGASAGEFVPILWRRAAFRKLDAGHFWLSAEPQTPGSVGWDAALTRMATWVRLQPVAGARSEFVVINTHFDHHGTEARLESARAIRRWIEKLGPTPVILIGDFNCGPDDPPYAELCENGRGPGRLRDAFSAAAAADASAGTFHAFRGAANGPRIDWILADRGFEPVRAAIDRTQRDGRFASDHFAITALLRWAGPVTRVETAATASQAASRPFDDDPARFAAAIRAFEDEDAKSSPPAGAVLFVGSSSIVGWRTAHEFRDWTVLNRGFGGSHLSDVNHFFESVVEPYRARAIVLYAGDNDIAAGKPPERVRDDFVAFVARVRTNQPDVPIAYLSIKPSPARWGHWPAMKQANQLIVEECARRARLRFVDVGSLLLNEAGMPRGEMYAEDRLHLSQKGYAAWTAKVKQELADWMK